MRIASSVTAVSWIPSEAVTGAVYKVPFEAGLAHYDEPPPDVIDDFEAFIAADRCRFVNQLSAWVDVEDGRVMGHGQTGRGLIGATTVRLGPQSLTFTAVALPDRRRDEAVADNAVRFEQTAGGRTGVPAPRRVSHPPYVQLAAPLAWTTLSLTLQADGTTSGHLEGASPFPRHWIYDSEGRLQSKSAVIDYSTWSTKAFGRHSPWGEEDSPALVSAVETALERKLSREIMTGGRRPQIVRFAPGEVVTQQGDPGDVLYLVLDGVLDVEVNGDVVTEVGPGALLGERALLEGGLRTATLRTVTACAVAVVDRASVDAQSLQEIAKGHRREERDAKA